MSSLLSRTFAVLFFVASIVFQAEIIQAQHNQTAPQSAQKHHHHADANKDLTPQMVIDDLKAGNKRYVANNLTSRNHEASHRDIPGGQHPEAVILSCIDSRVLVEDIFDKAIGDLFVGRVAGNIVNTDLLGSMEYGCKVTGSKLILVLGHESCGAVKSAIDKVEMGNITALLAKINPAIESSAGFDGEHNIDNHAYVEHVTHQNVMHTVEQIRAGSPILKEMEDKGEIRILGAYYSLQSGEVIFFE